VDTGDCSVYFCDENGWETVVNDVRSLQQLTKAKYPHLPYFLLGHSMGSFITRTFLIRYAGTVDGAIVMGSGWQPTLKLAGGRTIAKLAAKRYGRRAASRFINQLAFGGYNKAFAPNKTDFDWIAADPDTVKAYAMDPLCGQSVTIGLFQDMLGGIHFNQQMENLRKMDVNTPILFISGQDDPVGDMGKGVVLSRDAFTAAGVKDTSLLLYPGLRHEILNEASREQVYGDILRWLEKYL
jgi:alpha-beta hydrolase superfamily lysophospholipase